MTHQYMIDAKKERAAFGIQRRLLLAGKGRLEEKGKMKLAGGSYIQTIYTIYGVVSSSFILFSFFFPFEIPIRREGGWCFEEGGGWDLGGEA